MEKLYFFITAYIDEMIDNVKQMHILWLERYAIKRFILYNRGVKLWQQFQHK